VKILDARKNKTKTGTQVGHNRRTSKESHFTGTKAWVGKQKKGNVAGPRQTCSLRAKKRKTTVMEGAVLEKRAEEDGTRWWEKMDV